MAKITDQDEPRKVGDRLAPATTPDKDTIKEDRAALDKKHEADRPPSDEEEEAAERAGEPDPAVAEHFEEMTERGAAQEGEGKPGL